MSYNDDGRPPPTVYVYSLNLEGGNKYVGGAGRPCHGGGPRATARPDRHRGQ